MTEIVIFLLFALVIAGWITAEIKDRGNRQALLDLATEIISNQIGQTADLLDRLMSSSFGEYASSFSCLKPDPQEDDFSASPDQIYDDDGIIE